MRVIAGSLGGRLFAAPAGHTTHPMGDRVRGGLFNALGDIAGLRLLDAFGGSGALAIEALSRGAASAVILDNDRRAVSTIRANLKSLGLVANAQVTQVPAATWSNQHLNVTFDLVFCDPPYDQLSLQTIQKLARHVAVGGILILSWPGKLLAPELVALQTLKTQSYGDAQIIFYRRLS